MQASPRAALPHKGPSPASLPLQSGACAVSVKADMAKQDCRASEKRHTSECNCAFVCKLTSSVFHLLIH